MIDDQKLKEILLRENYITQEDVKKAELAGLKNQMSLADFFISQNILTKDLLGQAIAESFGVPYSDLNSNPPSKDQVLKIPEELAKTLRAVIFKEDKQLVVIATDNPLQKNLPGQLQELFPGRKIAVTYSLSEDVDGVFNDYQKTLQTRFSKIIEKEKRIAPEILEEIFSDALLFRASDIHFEPQQKHVVVRFRVDGVLHEAGQIPNKYYENILNRIKVQSHLRMDEHFSAQDGSMRFEKHGNAYDLRVSIIPTVEGEKIVLRVLASYIKGFSLGDIGLSKDDQDTLRQASDKPFGMILVVGPTGSGKTTTLYSVLKILNQSDVNITTIEDPVEYKVVGVNQIQVNADTNLTFAKGLRSIVRQDPDIILVGEIRDGETAEIAVNAALTGHLLLSTFHANDAATAIPRLLDMDVEPFLLASTLNVVVAQRLVRKICEDCRLSFTISAKELEKKYKGSGNFFTDSPVTLYRGKGCQACSQTGYRGRTAIFEFIQITSAMQDLILTHPSATQVWKLAKKQGSKSVFEDGIEKVKNGITTLEELLRVAEAPSGKN